MTGEIAVLPARRRSPSPTKLVVDGIIVFCDYHKGRGITVSTYMACGRMLNVTQGKSATVETMARLHKPRVERAQETAKSQIAAKSGAAWNVVETLLKEHDIELVES
jgi:hypothetical protein